jgi:putative peptide maturation dehydrogenase
MPRLRRSRYLAFSCRDEDLPDFPALLRGEARLARFRRIYALSILRGKECPIAREELDLLLSVPSAEWVDSDGMDGEAVTRLARLGLLVTDDDDEELAELARRERELDAGQWNIYGALTHFLTKWRDLDLGAALGEADVDELPPAVHDAIEDFAARHGPAPPAFHSVQSGGAVHELPLVERRGGLYDALAQRKTSRRFDRGEPMALEELATVLYYVFGCHGHAGMAGDGLMIKRTSPSGGGLHPIEVYPLVAGVAGLPTGFYHYDVGDHSLVLVAEVDAGEVGAVAGELVCGQRYFSSAHVLFLMTARFYRSFWKYRRHPRAYSALLMDAAHLSQTLYLVAAELGLGAFYTAAVNGANIEERLGIDGWAEGALAVCGCGRRPDRRSPLEPDFAPYVPRETRLPAGR